MHAFQLLADEHQSLAAMLHAMHFTLKEIAAGRLNTDAALLRAMAHYLTAYPQHCHHPREERLLFERLRARTDAGDAVLAELQAAHDASAEHGRTLHTALDAYLAGGDIHTLSAAFDQWADFYRGLMLREEQQLLPLLRAHLSADDWAAMDAEADPPSAEFTALFSRLVAAAPAPVGLGQGPYVEPPAAAARDPHQPFDVVSTPMTAWQPPVPQVPAGQPPVESLPPVVEPVEPLTTGPRPTLGPDGFPRLDGGSAWRGAHASTTPPPPSAPWTPQQPFAPSAWPPSAWIFWMRQCLAARLAPSTAR